MEKICEDLIGYGYFISHIHARRTLMLSMSDIVSSSESDRVEDLYCRMQGLYPLLCKGNKFTRKELQELLRASLLKEAMGIANIPVLLDVAEFFLNGYRINNFFYLLERKEGDPYLNSGMDGIDQLGYFGELDALKVCKDMNDVCSYFGDTFLSGYLHRVNVRAKFSDNNFMLQKFLFDKFRIEDFARLESNHEGLFNLIKIEGDVHNINTSFTMLNNRMPSADPSAILTKVTTLNYYSLLSLVESNGGVRNLSDIVKASNVYARDVASDSGPLERCLLGARMRVYASCFNMFCDASLLLAYLRLKEQEIKNIVRVADCILSGDRELMEDIVVPEE